MADSLYFKWSDRIDGLGTWAVEAGSADATYGVSRLTDGLLTSPLKITPTTGVATVTCDFGGTPRQVVAAVLANHNLPANATVFMMANATNSWGAPSFGQTFAAPTPPDGAGIGRTDWFVSTMPSVFRWVRFGVAANAPTPTVWGEVMLSAVARVWAGTHTEFQPGIEITELRGDISIATGGFGRVNSPEPTALRRYTGRVVGTYTQLQSYVEWHAGSYGRAKAFPIYIGSLGKSDVVTFDTPDLALRQLNGQLWELTLSFVQVSHGPGW